MTRHVVTLSRMETSNEGTFGKLRHGDLRLYTGEPPWKNNQPNVSCIPPGEYICTPHKSPTFGPCFKLMGVPGRTNILIHPGNWVGDVDAGYISDSKGCICPGTGRKMLKGQDTVGSSKAALEELMDIFPQQEFTLKIEDRTGGRAGFQMNE